MVEKSYKVLKKYAILRNSSAFLFTNQQMENNDIICEMIPLADKSLCRDLLLVTENMGNGLEFGDRSFYAGGFVYSLLPVEKEVIEKLQLKVEGCEGRIGIQESDGFRGINNDDYLCLVVDYSNGNVRVVNNKFPVGMTGNEGKVFIKKEKL